MEDIILQLRGVMLGSSETITIIKEAIKSLKQLSSLLGPSHSRDNETEAAFHQAMIEALGVDLSAPSVEKGLGKKIEQYLSLFSNTLMSRRANKVTTRMLC